MMCAQVIRNLGMLFSLALLAGAAQAQKLPYTPDEATLHLYHFNSADIVASANGVTTVSDAVTSGGLNLGLEYNAVLTSSTSGFAQCLNTSSSTPYCRATIGHRVALDTFWNQTTTTLNGKEVAQGACTYEAVVYLGMNPFDPFPSALDSQHQIMSLEGPGATGRPMQFRIYGKFNTHQVTTLEFVSAEANLGVAALLPETGPHAAVKGKWYHVAAAYNGRENEPGNIKLYWTALDSDAWLPNELPLLASVPTAATWKDYFTGDLRKTATGTLMVGSQARSANCPSFKGYIDEVRISKVARTPEEMQLKVKPNAIPQYTLYGER